MERKMKMINLFKSKKSEVFSPVCGELVSLDEVKDPVFSSKMMGDGVAFRYEGSEIFSPCDGEIIMVAQTKHALGFRMSNGAELLLHIGLDTVNLNGKGFELNVKEGQKIKIGESLIKLDRNSMSENKIDMITPLIITNGQDYKFDLLVDFGEIEKSIKFMEISKK